jgi:hypothetical protein
VDGARDQFLSRAGFPEDQHISSGGSNHFYLFQNPHEIGTSADNLLKNVVPGLVVEDVIGNGFDMFPESIEFW